MNREIAFQKLARYCAYQDRCHKEVRSHGLKLGIYGDLLEEVMSDLVKDDFLNEMRFAKSYTRGKHHLKRWGRMKIRQELVRRDISPYCIKTAFKEINPKTYEATMKSLASVYLESRRQRYDKLVLMDKLYKYLFNKGYESELITPVINALFP